MFNRLLSSTVGAVSSLFGETASPCTFAPGAYADAHATRKRGPCLVAYKGETPDRLRCGVRVKDDRLYCDVLPEWRSTREILGSVNDILGVTQYIHKEVAEAILKAITIVVTDINLADSNGPTKSILNSQVLMEDRMRGLSFQDRLFKALAAIETQRAASNGVSVSNIPQINMPRPPSQKVSFLLDPTALHKDGVLPPVNGEVLDPARVTAMFAPVMMSWVVLFWIRATIDDKKWAQAYMPLQMIKNQAKKDRFVGAMQSWGYFDDKTHTFFVDVSELKKSEAEGTPAVDALFASKQLLLLYIEALFNEAMTPDVCKVSGGVSQPNLAFEWSSENQPAGKVSVNVRVQERVEDFELLVFGLRAALRGHDSMRGHLQREADGVSAFQMTLDAPTDGKLFRDVWEYVIAIVVAKWVCFVNLQRGTSASVSALPKPHVLSAGTELPGPVKVPTALEVDRAHPLELTFRPRKSTYENPTGPSQTNALG